MSVSKQAYYRLGLVLIIYVLLSLAHNVWLPLHRAPDEVAHFLYSRFIARTGHLPLNAEEREAAGYLSFWPPLYHTLVAISTGWSDRDGPPYLKLAWESPRFDLAQALLDTKRLANTEDELMPYRGAVLMWRLGRGVSMLLSLGTIVVTFFTALEIFPHRYRLAILAASIIAFVPTFIFISASMSYEPLVGLLTGLYFWVLVKMVKGDLRLRNWLWLGLFMGLSVTAKYATVILPIQVVTVSAYLAWQQRLGWWGWLKRIALTATVAILASSWWFLFLIINFNEIDQLGLLVGSLKPILAGGIDASQNYTAFVLTGGKIGAAESLEIVREPFGAWAAQIYQSFWVMEIGNFPLGPLAPALIGLIGLLAGLGLGQTWQRQPGQRIWIALLIFHFSLFLVFPFLRFLVQGKIAWTAQGRHVLFPAATILPLLLIYSWPARFTAKTQRRLGLVLVAGLVCWSVAQLIRVATYYPPPLPVRTTVEAATQISHRLDKVFGEHLLLLGYDLQLTAAPEALRINLYWQSPSYADEDYLVRVNLVQEGITRLEWLAYPVNGRYPTRIWESWETIRDELWLPLTDLPPGDYQVQLQIQGAYDRLAVDGADTLILDQITVSPTVPSMNNQVSLPVAVEGREVVKGLTLWQAEAYRGLDLPEYRPRMAISFVWQGQPEQDERVEWLLVDGAGKVYPSQQASPHFEYFIVGPDWQPGDYRLRVEVWREQAVIASQETGSLVRIINEQPRLITPPPIAHPLEANFANRVKLMGYVLPVRSLLPGQGIPVTFYWQGLRTMGESYTFFTKLLDNKQQLYSSVERLAADGYSTIYWQPQEVVTDSFELPVPASVPPGIYWLNLGLYQEKDQIAIPLPLLAGDQESSETSLTLGPVKIGGPPPGVVLSPQQATPQNSVSIKLGDPPVILLRGYNLAQSGDNLYLTFFWESLAATSVDWSIFVHVRNQAGETIAQKDGPAGGGVYPTSLWEQGEIIADPMVLPLSNRLAEKEYSLIVGLYQLSTGQRLTIPTSEDNSLKLIPMRQVNPE